MEVWTRTRDLYEYQKRLSLLRNDGMAAEIFRRYLFHMYRSRFLVYRSLLTFSNASVSEVAAAWPLRSSLLKLLLLVCAAHCSILQNTATFCNTLQHSKIISAQTAAAGVCDTLQHTVTHCNSLQHSTIISVQTAAASVRIILQHSAPYCNRL